MVRQATVYLKPGEGGMVRDPISMDIMPPEGMFKPFAGVEGKYWKRRVKDGDCVICLPPAKKKVNIKSQTSTKNEGGNN